MPTELLTGITVAVLVGGVGGVLFWADRQGRRPSTRTPHAGDPLRRWPASRRAAEGDQFPDDSGFVDGLVRHGVQQSLEEIRAGWAPPVPAGLRRRFLAAGFDHLIAPLLVLVVAWVAQAAGEPRRNLWWLYDIFLLAYRLSTTLIWRRTPGKGIFGVGLVSMDGGRVSAGQVLKRETAFVILVLFPPVILLHALLVVFRRDHRALHDHPGGTIVVGLDQTTAPGGASGP